MNDVTRNTKDKILDAAEILFKEQGFASTSTRAIAKAAGVNSAAPNFHFNTKSNLIKAVFERRMGPLNEQRMELAKKILSKKAKPSVEDIIDITILPLLDLHASEDEGKQAFLALIARSTSFPMPELQDVLAKEMGEYSKFYVSLFKDQLQHLEYDELVLRLDFMIGSIAHALSGTLRKDLMEPSERAYDMENIYKSLKAFVVAGLKAESTMPTTAQ